VRDEPDVGKAAIAINRMLARRANEIAAFVDEAPERGPVLHQSLDQPALTVVVTAGRIGHAIEVRRVVVWEDKSVTDQTVHKPGFAVGPSPTMDGLRRAVGAASKEAHVEDARDILATAIRAQSWLLPSAMSTTVHVAHLAPQGSIRRWTIQQPVDEHCGGSEYQFAQARSVQQARFKPYL
jgi:hypothetical protein